MAAELGMHSWEVDTPVLWPSWWLIWPQGWIWVTADRLHSVPTLMASWDAFCQPTFTGEWRAAAVLPCTWNPGGGRHQHQGPVSARADVPGSTMTFKTIRSVCTKATRYRKKKKEIFVAIKNREQNSNYNALAWKRICMMQSHAGVS